MSIAQNMLMMQVQKHVSDREIESVGRRWADSHTDAFQGQVQAALKPVNKPL